MAAGVALIPMVGLALFATAAALIGILAPPALPVATASAMGAWCCRRARQIMQRGGRRRERLVIGTALGSVALAAVVYDVTVLQPGGPADDDGWVQMQWVFAVAAVTLGAADRGD